MSEAQQPPSPRPRRTSRVLRVGLLLAAVLMVAAGGVALYRVLSAPPPPTPPEAKGDALEPAVVKAVGEAREHVLKNPRSAGAWGDLGEVFLANELEEESRPCFAEAERLDPADPRWPYFQSGPLLNRGEWEAALPFLTRAIEHCPAEGEAAAAVRLRLAETLLILGRSEEAEAHLRHVLDKPPEDPRARFDMGLLAISREDWPRARAHLFRCLGSPFTQQKARVQLAAVCRRLGEAKNADEFGAQADRIPPDLDWVDPFLAESLDKGVKKKNRYRRVEYLEATGHIPEAIDWLRPMAAQYPDDYLPQLTLGKLLAQRGNYPEAEQALRRALRLAPDKVQAHYYLSLLLLKEGEELADKGDKERARAEKLFEEAASLARQALAIKPDYGFAQMALGLALKHLGQRADGLAALRQAVRCNPEFAELHFRLGEWLAEDGQADEARACLEEALRLAPPEAPWRQDAQTRLAKLPKGARPENPPGP